MIPRRREEAEALQGLHSLSGASETFNETIADPVGFEPKGVQTLMNNLFIEEIKSFN